MNSYLGHIACAYVVLSFRNHLVRTQLRRYTVTSLNIGGTNKDVAAGAHDVSMFGDGVTQLVF